MGAAALGAGAFSLTDDRAGSRAAGATFDGGNAISRRAPSAAGGSASSRISSLMIGMLSSEAGLEKSKFSVETRPSSVLTATIRSITAWFAGSRLTKRTPIPSTMPPWATRTTSARPRSSTNPSVSENSNSMELPSGAGASVTMNIPDRLMFIDCVSTKSRTLS